MEITLHAKRRYAQRVAKKEDLVDMNAYVVKNEEMIVENINKMIEHSELIYRGKIGENDISNVYISGTWVLIVDKNDNKVITLYKIEFGVGEDFNRQFVERQMESIDLAKEELQRVRDEISNNKKSYEEVVETNKNLIREYKTLINNLEKTNSDYKNVINDLSSSIQVAEMNVRSEVEKLVMERRF